MNIKKINYKLGKLIFGTALNCFYRDIDIIGADNIPHDKPVLFISNHNNAFVDPLLMSVNHNRVVTLTAKNTLADNPVLKVMLKFCSVELLSRRVDRSSIRQGKLENQQALQRLAERFSANECVYMFPEGKSHSDAHLHPFKSGAARLALDYSKTCPDGESDLVIVPLGLHYENKSAFRSRAHVCVGTPLAMSDWLKTHDISHSRELTLEFEQMVSEQLATDASTKGWEKAASKRFLKWEHAIVAAPFGLAALVVNCLPLSVTTALVRKLSNDHDHPASAAIVVGPIVFAVFHLLQMFAVVTYGSWLLLLLYLVFLIPCSMSLLSLIDSVKSCAQKIKSSNKPIEI